eukprot:g6201.t1
MRSERQDGHGDALAAGGSSPSRLEVPVKAATAAPSKEPSPSTSEKQPRPGRAQSFYAYGPPGTPHSDFVRIVSSKLPYHARPDRPSRTLNDWIAQTRSVPEVLALVKTYGAEFDGTNTATALHRLAKWHREAPDARLFQDDLWHQTLEHLDRNLQAPGFQTRHLTSALWSFATLGWSARRLLRGGSGRGSREDPAMELLGRLSELFKKQEVQIQTLNDEVQRLQAPIEPCLAYKPEELPENFLQLKIMRGPSRGPPEHEDEVPDEHTEQSREMPPSSNDAGQLCALPENFWEDDEDPRTEKGEDRVVDGVSYNHDLALGNPTSRHEPTTCGSHGAAMKRPAKKRRPEGEEDLTDAVVKVFAAVSEPNYAVPWVYKPQDARTGTAFAVTWEKESQWLLTNAHVIRHAAVIQVRKRGDHQKRREDALPRLQEEVTVVGYPIGGDNACVTVGVVSRIDMQRYNVCWTQSLLAIQIDAAINPGNSGGPCFGAGDFSGCLLGVAFQVLGREDAENIGYIIPAEVVHHFLTDYIQNQRYTGFGSCGFAVQPLENARMRLALGLKPHQSGVRVTMVHPASAAHEAHVFTWIGWLSEELGCKAKRSETMAKFHFAAPGMTRLDLLERELQVQLSAVRPLVLHDPPDPPQYFIIGGLVFVPLSEPFLWDDFGANYHKDAPISMLWHWFDGVRESMDHEVIVLSQVLASPLTVGFTEPSAAAFRVTDGFGIQVFNGRKVKNLEHLMLMVQGCEEPLLVSLCSLPTSSDMIAIPISAFEPDDTVFSDFMGWLTQIFWTFDIIMSLLTGYVNKGQLVMSPYQIFINYLLLGRSSRLATRPLSFLGTRPGPDGPELPQYFQNLSDGVRPFLVTGRRLLRVITFIQLSAHGDEGGSAGSVGRLVRTIRVVRTVRLLRLVKLKRVIDMLKDRITSEVVFILLNILKLIILLLLVNHFVASLWYLMGGLANAGTPNWRDAYGMQPGTQPLSYRYATALHWSLTQFTPATVDVHPQNMVERTFAILVLIFGLVLFSSFVSSITASMTQLRNMQDGAEDKSKQFWLLRRYLLQKKVPQDLTFKVLRYTEYATSRSGEAIPEHRITILSLLTKQLQSELRFVTHFGTWASPRTSTGKALVSKALASQDPLFELVDPALCMYFVDQGQVQYCQGQSALGLGGGLSSMAWKGRSKEDTARAAQAEVSEETDLQEMWDENAESEGTGIPDDEMDPNTDDPPSPPEPKKRPREMKKTGEKELPKSGEDMEDDNGAGSAEEMSENEAPDIEVEDDESEPKAAKQEKDESGATCLSEEEQESQEEDQEENEDERKLHDKHNGSKHQEDEADEEEPAASHIHPGGQSSHSIALCQDWATKVRAEKAASISHCKEWENKKAKVLEILEQERKENAGGLKLAEEEMKRVGAALRQDADKKESDAKERESKAKKQKKPEQVLKDAPAPETEKAHEKKTKKDKRADEKTEEPKAKTAKAESRTKEVPTEEEAKKKEKEKKTGEKEASAKAKTTEAESKKKDVPTGEKAHKKEKAGKEKPHEKTVEPKAKAAEAESKMKEVPTEEKAEKKEKAKKEKKGEKAVEPKAKTTEAESKTKEVPTEEKKEKKEKAKKEEMTGEKTGEPKAKTSEAENKTKEVPTEEKKDKKEKARKESNTDAKSAKAESKTKEVPTEEKAEKKEKAKKTGEKAVEPTAETTEAESKKKEVLTEEKKEKKEKGKKEKETGDGPTGHAHRKRHCLGTRCDEPAAVRKAIGKGGHLCEIVLWAQWRHVGSARAIHESNIVQVIAKGFAECIRRDPAVDSVAAMYARMFVQLANDRERIPEDWQEICNDEMTALTAGHSGGEYSPDSETPKNLMSRIMALTKPKAPPAHLGPASGLGARRARNPHLHKVMQEVEKRLPEFTCVDLALTAWPLRPHQQAFPGLYCRIPATSLSKHHVGHSHLEERERGLAVGLAVDFRPHEYSTMVWSMVITQAREECLFSRVSGHVLRRVSEFGPQERCEVEVGRSSPTPPGPSPLWASAPRAFRSLGKRVQNLTNVAWAYSHLAVGSEELLSDVARIAHARIHEMNVQDLAQLALTLVFTRRSGLDSSDRPCRKWVGGGKKASLPEMRVQHGWTPDDAWIVHDLVMVWMEESEAEKLLGDAWRALDAYMDRLYHQVMDFLRTTPLLARVQRLALLSLGIKYTGLLLEELGLMDRSMDGLTETARERLAEERQQMLRQERGDPGAGSQNWCLFRFHLHSELREAQELEGIRVRSCGGDPLALELLDPPREDGAHLVAVKLSNDRLNHRRRDAEFRAIAHLAGVLRSLIPDADRLMQERVVWGNLWNDMKHSVTRGLDVVDWDGDGFLDLVTVSSSEPGTEFAYASLDLHIQLHNDPLPKGHITLEDSGEFVSRPQLSIFDWDSDGKLDVLIGMASGQLRFFKGVDPQLPPSARSATLHHFQPAEEPHPFTSIHGHNNSAPAMAFQLEDEYPDLVLAHACQVDIFLGSADGSLHLAYSHYFDDGKCRFVPTVWDWDSDGKPDLIVGDEQGKLHLCKSDSMEQLQCSQEEFKILGVGSDASPAACDWDKDGVPDLFVYGKSELVAKPYWFRRNESGVAVMNPAHPLDGIDLGDDAVPTLVDWDRDGDLDLIVGSGDGRVWYFPWHNGSFHSMNGLDGPFAQIDVGSKAAPATVDWDLDGYPDLVVGNGKGSLAFFRGGPGKIDPAGS